MLAPPGAVVYRLDAMALRIETFDNASGGNTLYKALTHPSAAGQARALVDALCRQPPVAIYDPHGAAAAFHEIFPLGALEIAGVYVQEVAQIGRRILGRAAEPVTALARAGARSLFVAAFDAERIAAQIEPYRPEGAQVFTLDAMRIPSDRLTNRRAYLDPLNFATNFAFFRDAQGLHTRLVTANYWAGYGAGPVTCWLTLFDGDGAVIAEWRRAVRAGSRRDNRDRQPRGPDPLRLAGVCRPAFPPCRRRGRPRCRQIRARHLRRPAA